MGMRQNPVRSGREHSRSSVERETLQSLASQTVCNDYLMSSLVSQKEFFLVFSLWYHYFQFRRLTTRIVNLHELGALHQIAMMQDYHKNFSLPINGVRSFE